MLVYVRQDCKHLPQALKACQRVLGVSRMGYAPSSLPAGDCCRSSSSCTEDFSLNKLTSDAAMLLRRGRAVRSVDREVPRTAGP